MAAPRPEIPTSYGVNLIMPFVRHAVPTDLAALESFDQFHQITPQILSGGQCLVAGFDNTVLAYIILSHHFFNRRFIEFLFVHPDHRRKGLADALLNYAESLAPTEALWISTALGNFPIQSLLNRRGYKHSGIIHDLAPIPELIYHKPAATPAP